MGYEGVDAVRLATMILVRLGMHADIRTKCVDVHRSMVM